MEKEKIYLTDITLHMRNFRQTVNFSRVAQKGRLYSSLSKNEMADVVAGQKTTNGNNFSISINLPKDLMEKIERGEVELMMPKDGLFIYAGRDVYDFIEANEQKERRELIHRNRDNTWHVDKE